MPHPTAIRPVAALERSVQLNTRCGDFRERAGKYELESAEAAALPWCAASSFRFATLHFCTQAERLEALAAKAGAAPVKKAAPKGASFVSQPA